MKDSKWYNSKEQYGFLGMKILLFIKKICGRKFFDLILYVVVFFYYCFSKNSRSYSQEYLSIVKSYREKHHIEDDVKLSSYRHFYLFAKAMMDKIAVWNNELSLNKDVVFANDFSKNLVYQNKSGFMVFCCHLGNQEVCRALSSDINLKVNAIIHSKNAKKYKEILDKEAHDSSLNLFEVSEINAYTAMLFDSKIKNGELISIAADRVPINDSNRVVEVKFLDKKAYFPEGPFILAYLLKCNVYLLFPVYDKDTIKVYFEEFKFDYSISRKDRDAYIKSKVQEYASRLEYYTARYPLNFFNFYKFFY